MKIQNKKTRFARIFFKRLGGASIIFLKPARVQARIEG
jgi:hypothetical protein